MTKAKQARADELEESRAALDEMYRYLDTLREIGNVNMYGAEPYLERHFRMSKTDARKVLKAWMDDFS